MNNDTEDISWSLEEFDWVWPQNYEFPNDFSNEAVDSLLAQSLRLRKRAELFEHTIKAMDWEHPSASDDLKSMFYVLGSNARPQALARFINDIPLWAVKKVLPEVHGGWNMAIAPPKIDFDWWYSLWRSMAYCTDGPPRPTKPITLYRGGSTEDGLWCDWTTNPQVAQKFAKIAAMGPATRPKAHSPALWIARDVEPDLILGRVSYRDEDEHILDYKHLDEGQVEMRRGGCPKCRTYWAGEFIVTNLCPSCAEPF